MFLKTLARQLLSEDVGGLIYGGDLLDSDVPKFVVIADEVAVKFDVLVSAGDDRILNHFDAGGIVLEYFGRLALRSAQFPEEVSQPEDVLGSDRCRSVLRFSGRKGLALLHDCAPADWGAVEHDDVAASGSALVRVVCVG